jgi:hypothetical protein
LFLKQYKASSYHFDISKVFGLQIWLFTFAINTINIFNMKKSAFTKALLVVLLLLNNIANCQNPFWTLPNQQWKVGTGNVPSSLPTNAAPTSYKGEVPIIDSNSMYAQNGPHNMYPDSLGKPLFFIYAGYVFNKNGYVIDTLIDTLTINALSSPFLYRRVITGLSDVCIVPDPANCKKYFVFTTMPVGWLGEYGYYRPNACSYYQGGLNNQYNYTRPYYTVIDVSQQTPGAPTGELGKNLKPGAVSGSSAAHLYTATNTQPPSGTTCGAFNGDIHYASTKVINKNGATPYRLLFLMNNDEIITYKIANSTVTWLYTYDISTITGSAAGAYNNYGNLTELEIYQDYSNNKIKVAYGAPGSGVFRGNNKLVFMDFDTTGAFITGAYRTVCTHAYCQNGGAGGYIQGIEFSPNGSYVYFTHTKDSYYTNIVERVDYATGGNRISLSSDTLFQRSQIETGIDGNLYLFKYGSSSTQPVLYKITSPNNTTPGLSSASITMSNYPRPTPGDYPRWIFPAMTYYLPDQIDADNYNTLFNSSTSCCMFYANYDKYTYNTQNGASGWSATTQTWTPTSNPLNGGTSGTATIGQELRVASGYTVTIRNMTIKFTPQATFVVEGNYTGTPGKLILKKCTLDVDERCLVKMWPGVRVWGDNTTTRSSSTQGYIDIDSMCVITNAWVGVELGYQQGNEWKYNTGVVPKPPGSDSTKAGGGMIQCENSSFINNQRDIYFGDYTSNFGGTSNIHLCTFNTNAYLKGGSSIPPLYHIQFNNYKPLANIKGNTITCATSLTAAGYVYAHYGIYSLNSNYTVDEYTTGSVRNKISNMLYAVYGYNTGGNTNTFTVKKATLTNNKVGVQASVVPNLTVDSDTIKIWNLSSGNATGVFLDNCYGYDVLNNYFTKGTGSTSNNRYGVVPYNSGSYVNAIYKNTFTNLYKGSQAQYRNYITSTTAGTPRNSGGGLVYICNTFVTGTISNADIYVPQTGSNQNGGATYTGTDSAGVNYSQGTGSNYPIVGGNSFSRTGGTAYDFYIDSAGKAFNSNYVYYCSGGGCTANSVYPAKRKNVLVASAGTDINCSTNPYQNGFRISDLAIYYIDKASEYKYKLDSLKTILNGLPVQAQGRIDLGMKIGEALTARHRLIDLAIHELLNNYDDSAQTKISSLMKEKAMELPTRSRLEVAVNTNDTSWANSELSNLAAEEGQSPYVKVYTILVNNRGKNPEEIMKNPANLALIQAMVQDSSDKRVFAIASNLLRSIGLSDYQPPIQEAEMENDSASIRYIHENDKGVVAHSASSFRTQPNPFSAVTKIAVTVAEDSNEAFIVITNMLGSEIIRYRVQEGENEISFNGSEYGHQVYFCTLLIDGVKIKTSKMILIK